MSILDVTEDQIFQTLGKGKDPNFKPIEKVRPVIAKPKKTYSVNTNIKNNTSKTTAPVKQPAPVEAPVQPVISIPVPKTDDSVQKLTEDLDKLNNRIIGIQKMVKFYIVPQFVIVLVLIVLLLKS